MYPRDTCIPRDTRFFLGYMSSHVITCYYMLLHVITCHHSSSIITPDHPKGRCPFWVNFSSILGGSRDHLGVILGSSFKGSRGVPNIKKLTNFWVFENMSRDPPGGLLGSLGGVSLCRFHKILKKNWGSQNRSRTLLGAFLAHPWKIFFRAKIPSTID